MTRYLIYASYIGTRFCGSQYQSQFFGVQNAINNAAAFALRIPLPTVCTASASRTDAGVHALRTCYTMKLDRRVVSNHKSFDLKLQGDASFPFKPENLSAALNSALKEMNFDVRIVGCRIVSDGFCPRRHAKSRTYLYRLAALKAEFDDPARPILLQNPESLAPVIEKDRCWHVDSNFNPELFAKAAKMFEGHHDFRSFSSDSPQRPGVPPPSTVRSVKLVEVCSGRPLFDPLYEPLSSCFNYIDVLVHAKSFVYRQIRKMMAFSVAVAQQKVTCQDLQWMLDNPNTDNWTKFSLELAPPGGLYLANIVYDESDFVNPVPYCGEDVTRQQDSRKESMFEEDDKQTETKESDSVQALC